MCVSDHGLLKGREYREVRHRSLQNLQQNYVSFVQRRSNDLRYFSDNFTVVKLSNEKM